MINPGHKKILVKSMEDIAYDAGIRSAYGDLDKYEDPLFALEPSILRLRKIVR